MKIIGQKMNNCLGESELFCNLIHLDFDLTKKRKLCRNISYIFWYLNLIYHLNFGPIPNAKLVDIFSLLDNFCTA